LTYCRIVVKLGTSTLTGGSQHLYLPRMVDLVRQMAQLHESGCSVVLVSSGAIAAGRECLSFPNLPKDIPAKQMLAAVGQPRLMAIYEQLFSLYKVTIAQVLLTRSDLSNRRSYLNARSTLSALMAQRVIPIINENDTTATEEIRFGDNDNLSALICNLVDADLLALLTDQAGLFTSDPRRDPGAHIVASVSGDRIPEDLWQAAGGPSNGLGTGGMVTKLQAADLARRSGAAVVISRGSDPDIILRLAAAEPAGTLFQPSVSVLESRKRFILGGNKIRGNLIIDEGAVRALQDGGSLLAVGISRVEGSFERGDTVRISAANQGEIGRGLVNYNDADLARILGHKSDEIIEILGYAYGKEVIHRNNLVLL
jgi:glutamate 5-kinase